MNEKGLQLKGGCKHLVKFYHTLTIKKSRFYQICLDNLKLITIIKCVSSFSLSVPSMFILRKGPILNVNDLKMNTPIGGIITSSNGWTSNKIGLKWFKDIFIPFAIIHKVINDPILLLINGHDSYRTDDLQKLTYKFKVIVLAFPSKCTHKLQPLDV